MKNVWETYFLRIGYKFPIFGAGDYVCMYIKTVFI
jgi:hypothetical protein